MLNFWKILRLISIVTLCLSILAACGDNTSSTIPTITTTQYSTGSSDSLRIGWLNGLPCSAPCWQNIVPGKTTITQAQDLLNTSGLTFNVFDYGAPYAGAKTHKVMWRWQPELNIPEPSYFGGEITYDTQSQLVHTIEPDLNTSFRLDDIIKIYGEPDYVEAVGLYDYPEATIPSYYLNLFYLNKGIKLEMEHGLTRDAPPILANTISAQSVTFFIPSAEDYNKSGFDLSEVKDSNVTLVKWAGYQPFAYYCRDFDGRPACALLQKK